MNTPLQDGRYAARLVHAANHISPDGRNFVEFLWQLTEHESVTAKSRLYFTRPDGSPNDGGIAATRGWAEEWNGTDTMWFSVHLDFCRRYRAFLTLETDPKSGRQSVRRVSPVSGWGPAAAPAAKPEVTIPAFDAESIGRIPKTQDLTPTCRNVWDVFRLLTKGWEVNPREDAWEALINLARPRPDADQIDFTPDDWRHTLDLIKAPKAL